MGWLDKVRGGSLQPPTSRPLFSCFVIPHGLLYVYNFINTPEIVLNVFETRFTFNPIVPPAMYRRNYVGDKAERQDLMDPIVVSS